MKKLLGILLLMVVTFAVTAQTNITVKELGIPYTFSKSYGDAATDSVIFKSELNKEVNWITYAYSYSTDTVQTVITCTKSEYRGDGVTPFLSFFSLDTLKTATPVTQFDTITHSTFIKYKVSNLDSAFVRIYVKALE